MGELIGILIIIGAFIAALLLLGTGFYAGYKSGAKQGRLDGYIDCLNEQRP